MTNRPLEDVLDELNRLVAVAFAKEIAGRLAGAAAPLQDTATPPETAETIEDGFGSVWSRKCPECRRMSMEVVRPGKVQCVYCG